MPCGTAGAQNVANERRTGSGSGSTQIDGDVRRSGATDHRCVGDVRRLGRGELKWHVPSALAVVGAVELNPETTSSSQCGTRKGARTLGRGIRSCSPRSVGCRCRARGSHPRWEPSERWVDSSLRASSGICFSTTAPRSLCGWDGVCRLFEQLVPVLARHTSTTAHCCFAIWEGYGFDTSMTLPAAVPSDGEERRELDRERQRLREVDAQGNKSIRTALSRVPSFDLPHRRYYLVRGAITASSKIQRPDGEFPQPSDLWWPEDRRWFVGGDTDLDWCYIAGSERLVSAVGAEFRGQTRAVDWKASNAAAGE